ncbi:MAG: hypothetical protein R6V56_01450 [Lentisphaeria bacterium]
MAKDDNNTSDDKSPPDDSSLDDAISAFKGILEIFPEDIEALQSVFAASIQAGRKEEAQQHGIKLAELLSAQSEWEKVLEVTGKLQNLGIEDERIETLHQTAVDANGNKETGKPEAESTEPEEADSTKEQPETATLRRDLAGELDLAWMLLQNEVITDEQYEQAISSLSESQSSGKSKASICLLQELASIDRIHMDKVLGFLSAETNTPYIDIERFELDISVTDNVSLEEARRYGIMPFGRMKDELMVATLNPVDQKVRQQARSYFQRNLHFFLCSPDALQSVLDDLEAQKNAAK